MLFTGNEFHLVILLLSFSKFITVFFLSFLSLLFLSYFLILPIFTFFSIIFSIQFAPVRLSCSGVMSSFLYSINVLYYSFIISLSKCNLYLVRSEKLSPDNHELLSAMYVKTLSGDLCTLVDNIFET